MKGLSEVIFIVNEFLQSGTVVCSPDIYEQVKKVFPEKAKPAPGGERE